MSEESEQGMGGSWSPSSGQRSWKWHGSLGWSRAEEGCGLMWELRDPLMVTGEATEEAVRSLSKAEETEV